LLPLVERSFVSTHSVHLAALALRPGSLVARAVIHSPSFGLLELLITAVDLSGVSVFYSTDPDVD